MSYSPYEITLLIILLIILILMLKFYSKCSKSIIKKFYSFLFGFSSGILTLYPTIYIMANFGGIININIFTVTFVSILGFPGTALLAVASII